MFVKGPPRGRRRREVDIQIGAETGYAHIQGRFITLAALETSDELWVAQEPEGPESVEELEENGRGSLAEFSEQRATAFDFATPEGPES